MEITQYKEKIEENKSDHSKVGILLGYALKDKDVTPDQYEALCVALVADGVKISNIQVPDDEALLPAA